MTLEEIIHSVGYTQDGTKANFSFNEAKLIAQRYAQFKNQKLTDWKESMMKVHSELDLQGIGNALGLPLGSSIAPQVLPKVMELIEKNSELVEMLEKVKRLQPILEYQDDFGEALDKYTGEAQAIKEMFDSIDILLTKYNHLKSNTN